MPDVSEGNGRKQMAVYRLISETKDTRTGFYSGWYAEDWKAPLERTVTVLQEIAEPRGLSIRIESSESESPTVIWQKDTMEVFFSQITYLPTGEDNTGAVCSVARLDPLTASEMLLNFARLVAERPWLSAQLVHLAAAARSNADSSVLGYVLDAPDHVREAVFTRAKEFAEILQAEERERNGTITPMLN